MSIITSSSAKVTTTPTTTTAPNFLARFPRSLSQLNIGNKRKSTTAASPQEPQKPLPASPASSSSSSNTPISSPNHQQKSRLRHQHPTVTADVPPPLPQRNIPRKNSAQVSDLDASLMMAAAKATPEAVRSGSKKKNKQKAYSDPKMSSEMMMQMQMEASNLPPPLPPRTPGNSSNLDDGAFGQCVTNKDSFDGSPTGADGRPLPNSCSTQLHYPLITTSVAVRDGMLPPPSFHGHHHQVQHSFESVMNTSSSSLPPDLPTAVSRQNTNCGRIFLRELLGRHFFGFFDGNFR